MLIETKMELVNSKTLSITGEEEITIVNVMIDTSEILAIREVVNNEMELDKNVTFVYFKSGDSFEVMMPYKDLKELLYL